MLNEAENVCQESIYEKLFYKILPELRNFLLYKYRDLERAEDVVQEAFVILWKESKKVTPQLARAYLYEVAQNQLLKLIDKEKVKKKYLNLQTEWADSEDPAYTLEHKELSEKLKLAIEQLPDGQREVFLLNRIDRKTYPE